MAYDVAKLLTLSQSELDALFTNSAPGNIPDGEADDIDNGWTDYYFGPMKEYLESLKE